MRNSLVFVVSNGVRLSTTMNILGTGIKLKQCKDVMIDGKKLDIQT
jgi:hypothetical protein